MKNNTPQVSIVCPTYNGSAWISRAIASVQSQKLTDWELIVINDGSTDATAALLADIASKDTRIRVITNKNNLGIQKSLNIGLREAHGNYIARIDDDDIWIDTEKLEAQTEFLNTHSDYVLVGTGVVMRDEQGTELFRFHNPQTDEQIRSAVLYRNCFTHSTVLFRTNSARSIGGYREDKKVLHLEDYELWLRLGQRGKCINLPRYSVAFTVRKGGISAKYKRIQFLNQFRLIPKFRKSYPHYAVSRMKSGLRLALYTVAGIFIPEKLRLFILRRYKN